jgi:PAS domain S-box-containing protein
MTLNFVLSWHIWPVFVALCLFTALAAYAWRHRSVPGALPFTAGIVFTMPWVLGIGLQLLAADAETMVFWTKFQTVWQIPALSSGLCFALEYADLGRFLTRRTIALLALPAFIFVLLVLTNSFHHWIWLGSSPGVYARPPIAMGGRIVTAYDFLLMSLVPAIFVWLFIRSPLHRWPAALALLGQGAPRLVYLLDGRSWGPFLRGDVFVIALLFLSAMYSLVLFRFRLFSFIPIARGTMIEQMREGMLILDTQQSIIDLNPAAAKILGISVASARGANALQIFSIHPALSARLKEEGTGQSEIHLDTAGSSRDYVLHLSSLKNRRGFPLGRIFLFHDVTEQRRAEAKLQEQQNALATLNERVRIARELHDGLGQVLGYVKMQAEAARCFLAQGKQGEADRCLEQLVSVAQETHTDVREYISGADAGMTAEFGFLASLKQYLARFTECHQIQTELNVPAEVAERAFGPAVEVQLLRIIQEALTNARKHARAGAAFVSLRIEDGKARITVADDGVGFDVHQFPHDAQPHFGLKFMRERAEEVGGCVEIQSEPGKGTLVIVRVPFKEGVAR